MPVGKKDLQDAEAGADPDLNFGYNDLLEELKAEYKYEEREPGDVTAEEMSDATGLTRNWCSELLNKKVRAGELVKLKVMENGRILPCYVYRRKKTEV